MPSKYDTNPLDPDFPEKVKAEAEALAGTQVLGSTGAETSRFPGPAPTAVAEDVTRRFGQQEFDEYSSHFAGNSVPAAYVAAPLAGDNGAPSRKVAKIGLPENVMTAVPYIPWYLGMVAGLLILLLVPKSEPKVRFHAAQGLAAHIGILIVSGILGVIGGITDAAEIGLFIFGLVTSIMLVVFAIKAWQGKPVHIESVESLTNWLEEKIGPIKT